jgi:hypothetical protein
MGVAQRFVAACVAFDRALRLASDFQRLVTKYTRRICYLQRSVRGYLDCKRARILGLRRLWGRVREQHSAECDGIRRAILDSATGTGSADETPGTLHKKLGDYRKERREAFVTEWRTTKFASDKARRAWISTQKALIAHQDKLLDRMEQHDSDQVGGCRVQGAGCGDPPVAMVTDV